MGEFVNGIAVKGEKTFRILEAGQAQRDAESISLREGRPVLSAYIYDGDYWGYALYINGEVRDEFAAMPDDFAEGEGQPLRHTADLPQLARAFAVPAERIERYLRHWTGAMPDGEEFAYETDEFPYGDPWQMTDLLRALGFQYPRAEPPARGKMQLPSLQRILEEGLPANKGGCGAEASPLLEQLPSAFSPGYLWKLLADDQIKAFHFLEEDPQKIVSRVERYCAEAAQPERDPVCQRLNVLAAFCSYWMGRESDCWAFLDGATYEPIYLKHEKPTDVYLLRARAAVTGFAKRHRAIRDLKRLMELDPDNGELYRAEIEGWERREEG